MRLAVFGRPVAHSQSPVIHKMWGRIHGFPLSYLRVRVERVERILPMAELLDLSGFNVTAPYKEAIIPYLSGIDELSERLGAVNTVKRREGQWYGTNTDPDGVKAMLSGNGFSAKGQHALIIGAGGAAAAAALALQDIGLEVTIINRSPDRARCLAKRMGARSEVWEKLKSVCEYAQVLVLAAPLDAVNSLLGCLPKNALILEADYRNARVKKGGEQIGEIKVSGGLEWLVGQGASAFNRFTGIELSHKDRCLALKEIESVKTGLGDGHLCLIGLPGSGKSSVSAQLALGSKLPCQDLDQWIVQKEGATIDALFGTLGEEGFRDCEERALHGLLCGPARIIAMGGGIVERQNNLKKLSKETGVIWLAAKPEKLLSRVLHQGGRPLFANGCPVDKMQALHQRRGERYAEVAKLVLDAEEDVLALAGGINEELA